MPCVPRMRLVKRPGRSPYYTIKVGGKKHYLGIDEAEAHEEVARLLKDRKPTGIRFVGELMVAWRNAHPNWGRHTYSDAWKEFAADERLATLSRQHLVRYVEWLSVQCVPSTGRTYTPETIRKYYRFALNCLEWLVEQGGLAKIPDKPKRLPTPVKRPRDLDPAFVKAAFDKLPERARRVAAFILATGCRPGEARLLRWSEVDTRRKVAVLSEHKVAHRTGMVRTVHLPPAAIKLLRDVPKESDDWVFVSRTRTCYTRMGLRAVFHRHGLSGYALRHTFAQSMLDGGLPIEDVAAILGHKNLRTVQTYAQVRSARLRRVASGLTSLVQWQPDSDRPEKSPAPKDA